MEQQKSESPFASVQATAGLLLVLVRLFSLPVTALLHRGYGSKFVGLSGALAILPFFAMVLCFPHSSSAPLMCLLLLYIVRCAVARVGHLYGLIRGQLPKTHRQYAGRPLLASLLPQWSENAVLWLEPLGVFLVGFAAVWLTRPLGWYLILAGLAQAGWLVISHIYVMNKVGIANDAALEQQANAERFRELQRR